MIRRLALVLVLTAVAGSAGAVAAADPPGTMIAPPPAPAVGTTTPVATAELLVARPSTPSCTVELFADREFLGDARQPIAFVPPGACPGPWTKIVLEADFAVSAGEQFDRTGIINIEGVNLFTGTTMEPRDALSPRWHVERDVTDYAALFRQGRSGEALLTNYVDERYTGRIRWGARLVFHVADPAHPAPATADVVTPLSTVLTSLTGAAPMVERTLTLPRNTERVMIDVLAVPQGDDEFWYSCMPDRFVVPAKDGGDRPCGAPFRESEVRIDGSLAGLAPIYPWIYTGGMNPAMWTTVPGIETLDLKPYRIDLTPFAGLLNDGRPHRVSLTVAGVREYMFGMGTLLAWLDPGRSVVNGAITRNTLVPASLAFKEMRRGGGAPASADIVTTARRDGAVSGYVDTARGRVETSVRQAMRFANRQKGGRENSSTVQLAEITTEVTTAGGGGVARRKVVERFPLHIGNALERDGAKRTSRIAVDLRMMRREEVEGVGPAASRRTEMRVAPVASISIVGDDLTTFRREGSTVTRVAVRDSVAGCYDRTIAVRDQRVASVVERCGPARKAPR